MNTYICIDRDIANTDKQLYSYGPRLEGYTVASGFRFTSKANYFNFSVIPIPRVDIGIYTMGGIVQGSWGMKFKGRNVDEISISILTLLYLSGMLNICKVIIR